MALLAAPFAWVGYAVLLLSIFFGRRWQRDLVAHALLLYVPSFFVFPIAKQSNLFQIAAGNFYITAIVLVLVELARSSLVISISSHPQEEIQPLAK